MGQQWNWGQLRYLQEPAVPVQKAEPAHGLKAGMKVFHTKFGEGTVLRSKAWATRPARR